MEEAIEAYPKQELAQQRFQLTLSDDLVPNKKEIQQKLMATIEADSKCPDYILFNVIMGGIICGLHYNTCNIFVIVAWY